MQAPDDLARMELCPAAGSLRRVKIRACFCGKHADAPKPESVLEYFYKMARDGTDKSLPIKSLNFCDTADLSIDRNAVLWVLCLGIVVSGEACAQWQGWKKGVLDKLLNICRPDVLDLGVETSEANCSKRALLEDIATWTLVRPNSSWMRYVLEKTETSQDYYQYVAKGVKAALAKEKVVEARAWLNWYTNSDPFAQNIQTIEGFKTRHPDTNTDILSVVGGDPALLFDVTGAAFHPMFKKKYHANIHKTENAIKEWAAVVGAIVKREKTGVKYAAIAQCCKSVTWAERGVNGLVTNWFGCDCTGRTQSTIENEEFEARCVKTEILHAEKNITAYTWTLQCKSVAQAKILDGLYLLMLSPTGSEEDDDVKMLKHILRAR